MLMSQGVPSHRPMYMLIVIIVKLVMMASEGSFQELTIDNITYRPIPDDLFKSKNLTLEEKKLQECMLDLVQCKKTLEKRQLRVCARNKRLRMKSFPNFCILEYVICKDPRSWYFFHDGRCVRTRKGLVST